MKIESATIRWVFPPPFSEPVSDATLGPFTGFPIGLLELMADGLIGYGLLPVGRAAVDLAESIFLPLLWSTTVNGCQSIEDYWLQACRRIRNLGPGLTLATLSGVEMALWDLEAKRQNKPLVRLLGSEKRQVLAYGSNGWINYDLRTLVASVEALVSRGFTCVKVKVGSASGAAMDEDVRRVCAVRQALGNSVRIAVDANQCWNGTEALAFANKIADQGIEWFEEPVGAHNLKEYSLLAQDSPIPLAAGESLSHAGSFATLLHLRGAAIVQPTCHVLGGITGYLKAARVAADCAIPIISGGFSQLACSLVAAVPTGLMTEYLTPFMDTFQTVWQRSPRLVDGHFQLSEEAGHGLVPDMAFCCKYQRGSLLAFESKNPAPTTVY